jgi:hypothetical protein
LKSEENYGKYGTRGVGGALTFVAVLKTGIDRQHPLMAKSLRSAVIHNAGKLPTHSREGLDLTLIRWMLSLTPGQRLQVLQQNVRTILRL